MKVLLPQKVVQLVLLTVSTGGIMAATGFTFRQPIIAGAVSVVAGPVAGPDEESYGESIFQTVGCAGCHTLEAAGADGDTGPDLSAIGDRASAAYIRESISDPRAVLAGGCPEGPCEPVMPLYGEMLSVEQVDALVVYLSRQGH